MALYAALGACAFVAAALVYRYDLYEREPWRMLLLALVAGAVAMRLTGTLEAITISRVSSAAGQAALAAAHEEAARLALVAAIARLLPRQLQDPMDGIVYGSMVGLGMALEESLYFLGLHPARNLLLLPVELVRLFGHLIMGGIVGFGVGLASSGERDVRRRLLLCLAMAFGLHFLWDWLALAAGADGALGVAGTAGAVAVMLFGMLFYGALVLDGSRRSRAVFAPDSARTLWGWPFTALRRRGA